MAKFLTLTDKCNLRCAFCYEIPIDGSPHTFEAEPETFAPELYKAMHDEGWKQVVITGGEPTMMPTFFQAIAESHRQDMSRSSSPPTGVVSPTLTSRAALGSRA